MRRDDLPPPDALTGPSMPWPAGVPGAPRQAVRPSVPLAQRPPNAAAPRAPRNPVLQPGQPPGQRTLDFQRRG